ncbi:hypothetical protein RhiirA5_412143 [Rhizophagus irregularis]|uniref:Uncharacterized protein n=3 Tax=Rhizophagus irregularis TaxID=588596 RepID=A0A2N0PZG1_9GLOM|nr:hypothetical protein RhiirA5_412143 [Rhizophagus irregularis]
MPSIEVALDNDQRCFDNTNAAGIRNCNQNKNKAFFPPENEIWECHANNTNIAEAAHAQANREGKQLKLLTEIMRGRCLDERIFKIAETHDRYGVPYTRRDKSEIKRQTRAMRRKSGKQKEILKESKKKVPIQDINNQEKPEERGVKQRQQQAEI